MRMRMEVRAATLSLALSVCLLADMEVGKVQVLQVEPVRGRDLLGVLLLLLLGVLLLLLVVVRMVPFYGA